MPPGLVREGGGASPVKSRARQLSGGGGSCGGDNERARCCLFRPAVRKIFLQTSTARVVGFLIGAEEVRAMPELDYEAEVEKRNALRKPL